MSYRLYKYSAKAWLTRSSSPKILLAFPALYTMTAGQQAVADPELRARVFELAVGAELLQWPGELFYWREKSAEVDFVCKRPPNTILDAARFLGQMSMT